jgi:hypothetical protein
LHDDENEVLLAWNGVGGEFVFAFRKYDGDEIVANVPLLVAKTHRISRRKTATTTTATAADAAADAATVTDTAVCSVAVPSERGWRHRRHHRRNVISDHASPVVLHCTMIVRLMYMLKRNTYIARTLNVHCNMYIAQ